MIDTILIPQTRNPEALNPLNPPNPETLASSDFSTKADFIERVLSNLDAMILGVLGFAV